MSWTWESIATDIAEKPREMLAVVNERMKTLEHYLRRQSMTLPEVSRIRTTDATVATLVTVAIPVDTTLLVSGFVDARRTGGAAGATNDGAGYTVQFVAKNTAGTAALIGAGTVTVLGESQAGWDVALSASGGGIRVRVTGALDNNITWAWSGASLPVK